MPQLESTADAKYQHQLPTVSFRVIEDDQSLLVPAGVHSEQIRHYGYNDFSEFQRPEHYIRHIEPIESELAVQVEYDMDEQDKEWLDVVNAERKKEQSAPVSYEMFEIIMDKLEKEWFNLIKRIPQPVSHMPVEDSRCAICDDGEGENMNAIVFCDGCNLAVHQDCYGVPYIPEGQWLCRKCTVSPENPVSCIFCPNEGGAFKQTTMGHWSHLLCAIWIPELTVGNAIYMEPVQDVEQLPKSRWKLVCSLCRERGGACIQCDNKTCFTAFHVTCARQSGLLMTMKTLGTEGVLRAFCDKHLPAEMRDAMDSDDDGSEFEDAPKFHQPRKGRRSSTSRKNAVTSKTARAYAKSYRPGPPIVPQMIVSKLLDYVHKVSLSKRQPFLERLCRYWSLKREARRGAPLLKRLHLEPWTASAEAKHQTEAEKAVKLKVSVARPLYNGGWMLRYEFLTMLRNDLDKVRMLAELTRKREREKLRQAQVIKDMVDSFLFPHDGRLRLALEKISAMDRQELFLHHVNRLEVPDYYQVIKNPMCWSSIDDKLEANEYRFVHEFKDDINLVLDNAMTYNAPDNTYHRIAKRIKQNSIEVLSQLDLSAFSLPEDDSEVGDLEPATVMLETLISQMADESGRDRLAGLFAFELAKPKEPTPAPPTPPPPRTNQKRDSHVERKKRWEEREAAYQERLAQGRATRAGHAKVEAFKHEAGLPPSSDTEIDKPALAPRRRTRHSTAGNGDTLHPPQREDRESADSGHSRARSQVGVARTEPIERLSDKERREREKHLALQTEEVGNADQFTRFNVGWVLPEGSKRKRSGEKAQDAANSTPKQERKRTVSTRSEIVVEPAVAIETEMPEAGPSTPTAGNILESGSPLTPNDSTRDSSLSPLSGSETPASRRKGKGKAVAEPSPLKQTSTPLTPRASRSSKKRTATTETLDIPPRKSARQSSGRAKPVKELVPLLDVDMAGEEETAVESILPPTAADDDEDEVMTPPPDEPVAATTPVPVKRSRTTSRKRKAEPEIELKPDSESVEDATEEEAAPVADANDEEGEAAVQGHDEEDMAAGQLVWAKMYGFPYFPAVVLDREGDESIITPAVWASEAKSKAAHPNEKVLLVMFFDKSESFGWVPESKIQPLGVDDAIDQRYLMLKSKAKLKKEVREGYRLALSRAKDPEA